MTGKRIERALGYIRVSTQRQADGGVSLDNQEQKLGDHYRRLGIELVDIYRDGGLSGTTDNRPGLQALFEHALRPGSGSTSLRKLWWLRASSLVRFVPRTKTSVVTGFSPRPSRNGSR